MKLINLFGAVFNIKRFTNAKMSLSSNTQGAVSFLLQNDVKEVSCNDVYSILMEYETGVDSGENLIAFMPLLRQHLDKCPDCREKYKKLLVRLQSRFLAKFE